MRENVCWYYEKGWPFLLVEAATDDGARAPRPRRASTTRATLRREHAFARRRPRPHAPRSRPSGAIAA